MAIKIYTESQISQNKIQENLGKDWATVQTMMNYARTTPQHNLKNIQSNHITRKIKIA